MSILCRYEGVELIFITLFALLLSVVLGVKKRIIATSGVVYILGVILCLIGINYAIDNKVFFDKIVNYKKYYSDFSFIKTNAIFFSDDTLN